MACLMLPSDLCMVEVFGDLVFVGDSVEAEDGVVAEADLASGGR